MSKMTLKNFLKSKATIQPVIKLRNSTTATKNNGIMVYINAGFGSDCSVTPYTINSSTYGTQGKIKGYKGTATIHNMTGGADSYTYEVDNLTLGTTLETLTTNLANGQFSVISFLWSVEEIGQAGAALQFKITDGIIGTAAGAGNNGCVGFIMETIEEHENGIEAQ
jgi:hypothetical protein